MNKVKYFYTILVVIFFSNNAFSQSLTLEESIKIGMKNSKLLTLAESDLRITKFKLNEISSEMLPQLSFSASYIRLSDIPPFQVSVPFSPLPITISEPILNNYSIKLSLQQPLFTGFRLTSLKDAAELSVKSSDQKLLAEKKDYALRITDAFWNYALAIENEKLIGEELKAISRHLTDTKNFLENGLVTINDVLKIQVTQSSLELKKIEIENRVELARINFNRIIGLPLQSDTKIRYISSTDHINEYDIESLLMEASENRSELKSLQYKVKAAEENIIASQSNWYPSLYLFSNFYYSKPNQRIMPAEDQFNDTWDVGITLSWNLWDWGNRSAKVNQAEEIKLQSETMLNQLKDAIETEVYSSFLNYKKSVKKISVAENAVLQADENLRLTKNKYEVQLATSSDLIDAETFLYEAKINFITASIEQNIALAKLKVSAGYKIY